MGVVNEQGGVEGASVQMPYVPAVGGKRRKSCQEVADAKGAAELTP